MASLVKTDKISTTAGGAQEFTLPAADGTANQHLKTDGSGVLGWASPPSANPLTLTGSTNTWIPTITGADALTGTANFTYDGNTLDVKNSGTASSIKLYCESSNQHYQQIKAAPHAGSANWTLTLPSTVPSVSGQALTATTAGVSSWTTLSNNTPSFHVTLAATQQVATGTWTKVEWDTEQWDTNAAFDSTTNYRFTVPAGEDGKYFFGYGFGFDNIDDSEAIQMALYKNGVQQTRGMQRFFSPASQKPLRGTANSALSLVATDYVEAWVEHAEGATIPIDLLYTFFTGFKLAGV